MPLSKAKQTQWMREYRQRVRYNVIPNDVPEPKSAWNTVVTDDGEVVQFDADGNRIYDE